MHISNVAAQLRTTDLARSIRFYTSLPGFSLEFQYEDFYAGIRAGAQVFHLKLVDTRDASIDTVAKKGHFHLYFATPDANSAAEAIVAAGVALSQGVHATPWGTLEFIVHDDEGHTLYFGGPL